MTHRTCPTLTGIPERPLSGSESSYLAVGWDGHYHVEEYLDAGEAVVVIFRVKVRTPHGGGLQLEEPFTQVLQFEDGKVRRIWQYLSRAEGLEAAGLRE